MKNIFKKNQVIITALAIMIAVAGYLNFTKDSADKGKDQVVNSTNVNDDLALTDENDLYGDISDEDIADAGQQLNVSDDGSLVLNENADAETADGSVNKDDVAATDATGENAEVAGEDKVSSPGEAILASTTLDSSYFSTARLKREQVRSKNKELLWSIITSADVNEEDKKAALEDYTEIANISEKENAAEILLEAKGFDGVVVNIGEGTVDVIVNCESITDAQVAQIEDIVTRKTGADIKDIVITPVIAEE
ncbi:SpoIIIAH-like family protein [Clostridium sp. Marseille-P299]|uniref:SpoIIIAH-like family protein n=1 Tax=Clostridium sp. Marseille-P299 TaxID=1805477 RepID=UPI00082DD9B7|nr:SpoIIIAH-like family protein [Clostridium sp. Marseille-P299]